MAKNQPDAQSESDDATKPGEAEAELLDPNAVEQPSPLPKRIKLVMPYGFYDEDEHLRMWQAGQETDDPAEIELLVTRGAEHSVME